MGKKIKYESVIVCPGLGCGSLDQGLGMKSAIRIFELHCTYMLEFIGIDWAIKSISKHTTITMLNSSVDLKVDTNDRSFEPQKINSHCYSSI